MILLLVGVTYEMGFGLADWTCYTAYTYIHNIDIHESYPGNGLIAVSLSLQNKYEIFFSQSDSFLAISSQSPYTTIFRTRTIS
jgi:hypothetical protein